MGGDKLDIHVFIFFYREMSSFSLSSREDKHMNTKVKTLKTSKSWFGRKTKKDRKPKQEPGPQPHLPLHALKIWRKPRAARDKAASAPRAAGPPRARPARAPGCTKCTPRPPGHSGLPRTTAGSPGQSPPRRPSRGRA